MKQPIVFKCDVDIAVNNLRNEVKRQNGISDEAIAEACDGSLATLRCRSSQGELWKTRAYDMVVMARMIGKKWVLVDD